MMSGKPLRDAAPIVGLLCIMGGIVLIATKCTGCAAPPAKYPAYCVDEIAFTARLIACVDEAKTRTESRECRAAVHARCGIVITVTDGGTP